MAIQGDLGTLLVEESERGLPDRFARAAWPCDLECEARRGQIDLHNVHAYGSRRSFSSRDVSNAEVRTADDFGSEQFGSPGTDRKQGHLKREHTPIGMQGGGRHTLRGRYSARPVSVLSLRWLLLQSRQ